EGYDPTGAILAEDGKTPEKLPAPIIYTLATAALCNNAQLEIDPGDGDGSPEKTGPDDKPAPKRWRVIGDPTEGALLTLAAKGKMSRESMLPAHDVIAELPLDSDAKRMTV